MNLILGELRRLYRGWTVMREALGWYGAAAILLLAGLLLWALREARGDVAMVLGLICLLLLLRAHDLGDEPGADEDRTEFTEFWDPSPAAQRRREDAFLEQQRAANAAQVAFLKQRAQADLGASHEPQEL